MEIHKMLVISTSHVSRETARLIDYPVKRGASSASLGIPVTFGKGKYGWFVRVPEGEPDWQCPSDLKHVLAFARRHRCEWIMFDQDADVLPELPAFDW